MAIAEPAKLVGQISQLLTQHTIVPCGTVAHALAISIDDTARPLSLIPWHALR